MIKKIDGCANNPEKSSTIKIGDLVPSGHLMCAIWGFDPIENKHILYRGKDWKNVVAPKENMLQIQLILKRRNYYHQKYTKMQQHVIFKEKDSQKSLLKIKIIEELETTAILRKKIHKKVC